MTPSSYALWRLAPQRLIADNGVGLYPPTQTSFKRSLELARIQSKRRCYLSVKYFRPEAVSYLQASGVGRQTPLAISVSAKESTVQAYWVLGR